MNERIGPLPRVQWSSYKPSSPSKIPTSTTSILTHEDDASRLHKSCANPFYVTSEKALFAFVIKKIPTKIKFSVDPTMAMQIQYVFSFYLMLVLPFIISIH